jgi:hypothetical protein
MSVALRRVASVLLFWGALVRRAWSQLRALCDGLGQVEGSEPLRLIRHKALETGADVGFGHVNAKLRRRGRVRRSPLMALTLTPAAFRLPANRETISELIFDICMFASSGKASNPFNGSRAEVEAALFDLQSRLFEKASREFLQDWCFRCRRFGPGIERVNFAQADRPAVLVLDFYSFGFYLRSC